MEVLIYWLVFQNLFILVWNLHVVRCLISVDLSMVYYLHLWLSLHGLVFVEVDATSAWLDPVPVDSRVTSVISYCRIASRLVIFDSISSDLISFGHVHRALVSLITVIGSRFPFWLHGSLIQFNNF